MSICSNAVQAEANNAKPVWGYDETAFDLSMSVNAKGVFLGCKHASRIMKDQAPGPEGVRGKIVNTASILGLNAFPQSSTGLTHTISQSY